MWGRRPEQEKRGNCNPLNLYSYDEIMLDGLRKLIINCDNSKLLRQLKTIKPEREEMAQHCQTGQRKGNEKSAASLGLQ